MHANHSSSNSMKSFNLLLLIKSINQITWYCFKSMQAIQTIEIMLKLSKYCLMSVHLMNLSSLMACLVSWNKTFGLPFHIHDIVVCIILIWFYTTRYNSHIIWNFGLCLCFNLIHVKMAFNSMNVYEYCWIAKNIFFCLLGRWYWSLLFLRPIQNVNHVNLVLGCIPLFNMNQL